MGRGRAWIGAAIIVACWNLLPARSAVAGEYTYTLSYSADHSDNVRLAPTDQQSDLIHTMEGTFTFKQAERNLDARATGSVAYQDYQRNTFADQVNLGLDAALAWKPLPESFHWAINDVYTQVLASATQADTPANRVNTNVLSTGPDVFWRPDPVNTVQLGARYLRNTFSGTDNASLGTDADNTRGNGTIKWSYRYSPVTTLSLAHVTESVRFEDPGGTNLDFRSNKTTMGLTNQRLRNTFTVNVGKTRIDRVGQPEIKGSSGSVIWTRQLASDSTFSLDAARSLSDIAGQLIAGSGGTPVVGAPPGLNTSDIFTSKTVTLRYSRGFAGGTLSLSGFREKRVFELVTANNDDATGASARFSRVFSGRVTGSILVARVNTMFPTVLREDTDRAAAATLQYKFTRSVVGGMTVARRSRSSSDPFADFEENRIVLSLVYNSLPIRW